MRRTNLKWPTANLFASSASNLLVVWKDLAVGCWPLLEIRLPRYPHRYISHSFKSGHEEQPLAGGRTSFALAGRRY